MRVLRTIETFFPAVCGPAHQAFEISDRLQGLGVDSPVLTTYCDVPRTLPARETLGRVQVTRCPIQLRLMRYCVSLGMRAHLQDCDIVHSHNYRNFQSDYAFFLPRRSASLSS